jgi:hypothetical protein
VDPLGEVVPPGEAAAVARIVATIVRQYEARYPVGVRPALRDQHAKSHGCVRAELVVEDDLPAALRHGLFARPATHPAVIRFSASRPQPGTDRRRDARAMAIKVLDVPGDKVLPDEREATTQDLILANSPVFFCRDAADYVELTDAMARRRLPAFFVPSWRPWRWRLRELRNVLSAIGRRVSNPLEIRYWSQTPYALGPQAVKYQAVPTGGARRQRRPGGPDGLEEALARHLAGAEASFDLLVQRRTDVRAHPVEDPTVRWRERSAPFVKVATCRIPVQDLRTEERRAFAEALSFTPWHSLPEHRPLGGINRVRRHAYDTLSAIRHTMNDVPRREPSVDDVP